MKVKTKMFGVCDLIDYMVFRDYQKIFSQLSLLVLMFLLAVSLPMVTRLVQQSQETRSRATEEMTTNLNFKIAFKGIKPGYINNSTGTYNCFDQLGKLTTEIVNTTTNTYESVSNTSLEPIANQTNDDGDQVFKVVIPVSSTKFSNVNNLNYLRIKSNFSLASRMCQNNQTTKLDEASTCNISLNDSATVYDFSDYSLTPGDINQDGVVNSADYSSLKNNLNPDDDITCGKTGDLNFDGMVNSLDSSLIKEALSYQSDGLVLRPNQTITSIPTKTLTPTPTNKLTNTPTLTKTLTPTKTPTLTPTTTSVLTGTPYSSNSTSCQNQKGICTTYSKALSDDTACKVSGYSAIGNVKTGLCPGSTKVVCCTNITTSTLTPSPTKTVTPTMAQVGSGSLKFAVMSDLHDNNTGLKRMLQRAKDDNVSFVVMSGDLTNGGTTTQLKASKKILDGSGVRYIAIPGNHDIYRGMFDDIFGITYQSIRMGGVKLILINNSNDRGLGDEQKIWLESEVVECKTVICMAIMHMPLNHPTSKHIMGEDRSTTAEQAKWLRQLLISNKVKAIAAGHIHHFAEYTLEGIHTFLVGAGTNSDFSEFTIDSNGNVFREKINL